jgi:isocitrate lyase
VRLAEELGFSFYFDWEACRTEEGYYRVKGSIDYCVQRSIIFNDYADVLWMETDAPDLLVAQKYSQGVHAIKPHAILSYNLSPSFNWDAQKMTDDDLENFIPNLASMGYAWQFITLAGFHMDALISEVFTRNFAKIGMLGFVQNI